MKSAVSKTVLVLLLVISWVSSADAQGTRIDFSTIPKSGTILIYAHMDDDLIWMLPFWKISEKFIGGAMPATPTYRTIVSQQQSFMNSNGYNIEYQANWYTPWDDISDGEYSSYYLAGNESFNYLLNDHLETRLYNNPTELSRYEINKIKAKLEQYFADPSMRRVITHNNWGEYGHQHHKALNKAVRELAVKYRRDVWMLGCDNGGFIDVNVPNGITYTYGSFNTPSLYTGIRTIYSNNGLWTWYTDRVPSGDHKFIRIVEAGSDKSNILKGDPITYPGPYQQESGSFIFDGDDDYLTLKGNNNSSFTIAMRIRPDLIRAMDISAMSEYPGSGKNDRNLYLNSDGRVTARIFDGSSKVVVSSATVSANNWTHITISGNGSTLKLYINGSLDKTIAAGTAITNYATPELILGQSILTTNYFRGQINDVRMYNRALSGYEIAQLSGINYTVNSSAGEGGSITPSGSIAVSAGSDISFSIRANPGYGIDDVIVDNIPQGAITLFELDNISDNHTIRATFHPLTLPITAEAGPGGSIVPEGTINVVYGSELAFTIIPDNGYHISDVKVDGTSIGRVSDYTLSNITTDHSLTAEFSINTYTVTANSSRGGSVVPVGTTTINHGSNLRFEIAPDPGYHIVDVKVDGTSMGRISEYTFSIITANHTISAEFSINTYTISGNSTIGGSITPSGTTTANHGSALTFTIVPDNGYHISDVKVDGASAGTISEYTFNNITGNHVISAEFLINKYTITANCSSGGSMTPFGGVIITHGANQTFKISPETGYLIQDVLVDNKSVGRVSEYSFTNITGDHTISVLFIKTFTISVSAGPGGSISPSGNVIVPQDSLIEFIITPYSGYRINEVMIDNQSMEDISDYTFSGVVSDHSISATFTTSIDFKVFPNPFKEQLNLKIKSPAEYQFKVFILSLANKLIYNMDNVPGNTLIPLNLNIAPGLYILKLYLNGKPISTVKIIRY